MRLGAGGAPAPRPVIYRYVDVIKGGLALLEAIHFELFLPGSGFTFVIFFYFYWHADVGK